MEWMKRLRKESLRKVLGQAVLFLVLAAALFFIFDCASVFKTLSPKTLADLTPETMEGAYVEDDVYYFYTPYIEEEEYRDNVPTGKTTGMQYVIDFDETYYMGLFAHESALDEAEKMMEASDAYYNGVLIADAMPVMHVKGSIKAMDEEERGYYYEAAGENTDAVDVMLPYYIDVDRVSGYSVTTLWIMLAVSALLLVAAVYPLVKALTGGYQKKLRQKLAQWGDPTMMAEKLEQFCDSTEPVCGVRMGREFVFFQSGGASVVLRPTDLVWAYQIVTQRRVNFIPVGKTYAAVLRTADGLQYNLPMKKDQVQTLLAAIEAALPGVVLGYDKELEKLYRKDRAAFSRRWDAVLNGPAPEAEAVTEVPAESAPEGTDQAEVR